MEVKAIGAILFGGLFGILFIVVGIRRLLSARKGPNRIESIMWGIFGIMLGLAFFAGVAWLTKPVPANQPDYFDPTRPVTGNSN